MRFKLYWKNGRTEEVEGNSIMSAIGEAGYDSGDIDDLEKWEYLILYRVKANVYSDILSWEEEDVREIQLPMFLVYALDEDDAEGKVRSIVGPNLVTESLSLEEVHENWRLED